MQGDVLSDLLRSVRLSGAIFFEVDVAAPWVAAAPPSASIAETVIPGAEHVIEYHVLVEGSCWARVTNPDGEAIQLRPGSIIVFPHGDTHILASDPALRAEPDLGNFDQAARARSLPFRLDYRGEGRRMAHLLCGFLGCDLSPFNPLIPGLPRVIHVPDGFAGNDGFLGHLIHATVRESSSRSAGSSGIMAKLSELIFIEVLRRYAGTLPEAAGGWLTAANDPAVGLALACLHGKPAHDWTVAELAREAGVSRTVLAERFAARLGMPPMTYLIHWRMQRAAALLRDGHQPIARVADQVGYETEAAFSRAFKRVTGLPPAHWRKTGAEMRRKTDVYAHRLRPAPQSH